MDEIKVAVKFWLEKKYYGAQTFLKILLPKRALVAKWTKKI